MLVDSDVNARPWKGGLWPRSGGPPEGRLSRTAQILQAAVLGWCAVALVGSPAAWEGGAPLLLALCVWLGDPTRARYPSVMLLAVAVSATGPLWRPMVDGPAWDVSWIDEDLGLYLPLMAVIAFTGYGRARPTREFFGGPMGLAWIRRGLLIALAAAVGYQLTGLWRLGSRLGLGTPEDDVLFGAVCAILVAIGGIAFGRLFTRTSELHVAAALGVTSVLSFASLAVVGGISTPRGFRALCERFGADASLAGTAVVDAAVAGSIGVLPLLALGGAIHLARDRGALAALILGLLLGPTVALGVFPGSFESIAQAVQATGSAALPKEGAIAAGIALAVMAWAGRGPKKLAAAGFAIAALGALVPVSPIPILQPWNRFPLQTEAVFETVAGQFAIQADGADRLQVLLDQRRLLPSSEELGLDRAAIIEAFRDWEDSRPQASEETSIADSAGTPNAVLAIGLVSPERASVVAELGILRDVDRATTFSRVAPLLEQRLFEAAGLSSAEIPEGYHRPLHAPLSEQRWYRSGLTISFLAGAQVASEGSLRDGPEAVGNFVLGRRWGDRERPQAGRAPWSCDFVTDGLRGFAARSDSSAGPKKRRWPWTHWMAEGKGPSVFEWLQIRPDERPRAALRLILSQASPPESRELFHEGFVEFAAIQRVGSPFESPDERVILNERALSLWREFAIAQTELQRHERSMLEGAADALRAQGEVEWIRRFLRPIAAAHGPWPTLDETVAWAEGQAERAPGRLAIMGIQMRLTQLLPQAERATIGVITAKEAREIDPGDGAPLIFTGLTVRGTDLATGEPQEVQAWYPGGIIDENTGSFTADAPKRHQTRIGRGAVVFHRYSDNMGGELAGEVLVGGSAGLLNTITTADMRTLVLGKGRDGPSTGNIAVEELRSRFRALSGSPPNPPR